jgi:hypothetical protein
VVTQVLVDSRTFDKGGPLFEKARLLVGNGLVSSMWEDHRQQRRMLQPAFHPTRMPGYVRLMQEEIDDVLSSWEDGRTRHQRRDARPDPADHRPHHVRDHGRRAVHHPRGRLLYADHHAGRLQADGRAVWLAGEDPHSG